MNYSDSVVCLIFHLISIARWQFAKAKRYKTLFVSFSYLACCVAILVYAYIDRIGYKTIITRQLHYFLVSLRNK
jgi:hypothetical protein